MLSYHVVVHLFNRWCCVPGTHRLNLPCCSKSSIAFDTFGVTSWTTHLGGVNYCGVQAIIPYISINVCVIFWRVLWCTPVHHVVVVFDSKIGLCLCLCLCLCVCVRICVVCVSFAVRECACVFVLRVCSSVHPYICACVCCFKWVRVCREGFPIDRRA